MADMSLSDPSPPPTGAELGTSMGISYLGVALSSCVYGITCLQTYSYYRSRKAKSDHVLLQALVSGLWILDSAQQGCTIATVYHYVIVNYANPAALLRTYWSIAIVVLLDDVVNLVVQNFLIFRIWRLSKNVWATAICELLSLSQFGLNIVFPTKLLTLSNLPEAQIDLERFGISGLAMVAIADIAIAIVTIYYLLKNRTGFRRSESIIGRLVFLTISTGALTSCFVVAELIAYAVAPRTLADLFFACMQSKMYANALLTTLNGRDFVRGTVEDSSTFGHINSIPLDGLGHRGNRASIVNIQVSRTVEIDKAGSKSSLGLSDGQ